MTKEQAEELADRVQSLAISAEDGTILGNNVAVLIRECADEIRAEAEYLDAGGGRSGDDCDDRSCVSCYCDDCYQ